MDKGRSSRWHLYRAGGGRRVQESISNLIQTVANAPESDPPIDLRLTDIDHDGARRTEAGQIVGPEGCRMDLMLDTMVIGPYWKNAQDDVADILLESRATNRVRWDNIALYPTKVPRD